MPRAEPDWEVRPGEKKIKINVNKIKVPAPSDKLCSRVWAALPRKTAREHDTNTNVLNLITHTSF